MKKIKKIMMRSCMTAAFFIAGTGATYADTDPVAAIENLGTLITTIVSGVGAIILLYSIVQLGIAIKKHDPSATSESLVGVAAGLIVAGAPWVVNYIAG